MEGLKMKSFLMNLAVLVFNAGRSMKHLEGDRMSCFVITLDLLKKISHRKMSAKKRFVSQELLCPIKTFIPSLNAIGYR